MNLLPARGAEADDSAAPDSAAFDESGREFFELLPALSLIVSSPSLVVLDVNSQACRTLGCRREDLIGRGVASLQVGLLGPDALRLHELATQRGLVREQEARMRKLDGALIDVLMNLRLVRFAGEPACLMIGIDVTESRRMRQALVARERQLTSLIDSTMDAIGTIDAEHKVVLFNRGAAEMFQVDAAQAIGSPLSRFIPAARRSAHERQVAELMRGGERSPRFMSGRRPVVALRADGQEIPVEATLSQFEDSIDGPRATAILRDLSPLRMAEQARLEAAAAEAANAAKTRFLSTMSHELRTPLNAVLGFSQLLRLSAAERLSQSELQQLDHIFVAGSQLLALVNDILDLSRVEAGGLPIEARPTELCGLLESALRMSEPLAAAQGVELRGDWAGHAPLQWQVDPLRLRQVVLNFLSNAIKYNHRGGWVGLGLERRGDEVVIAVRDNGIGMDASQLAALFEAGNRLGREHSEIDGHGIGMALAREITNLLGGSIEVRSESGAGTEVLLTLGRAAGEGARAGAPQPPAAAPQGLVLCIDHDEADSLFAAGLVAGWPGLRFETAADGAHGIARALALRPDLILLAMNLPDMSGIEVLQALATHAETSAVPVVALWANSTVGDAEIARLAGACDCWTKPLAAQAFRDGLARHLDKVARDR